MAWYTHQIDHSEVRVRFSANSAKQFGETIRIDDGHPSGRVDVELIDSDTAVIQIWLGGGHSQFETFDPKPEAPVEYRGPYGVIPTKHAGISFCEKLPRTAQVIDQAALIRSITHTTNGHYVAAHWLSTGYPGNITPPTHPSSGSIVSHFRGANDPGLPPYVLLSHEQTRNPEIGAVMGTGYLGVQHAPFTVMQDPYRDEFKRQKVVEATSNLTLADNLTIDRVDDRRSLLQQPPPKWSPGLVSQNAQRRIQARQHALSIRPDQAT